jgi:hypothetical protein
MSGLLSRLAARAAGSTLVLRADARLPRDGVSGRSVAMEEGSPVAAGPAHRVVPEMPETPPAVPVQVEPLAHVPDAPQSAADVLAADVRAADVRAAAVPVPVHDSAADLPGAVRAPLLSAAMPAPVTYAPAPASAAAAAPAAARVAAGAMPPPAPALAAATLAPTPAPAPEIRPDPGADPVLLMARGPSPAPLAPVAPRVVLPLQGAVAQAAGADTEVHIHIGRIDVTAVQEAAAPRRSGAPVQAPMSLDAYLAQRGRT